MRETNCLFARVEATQLAQHFLPAFFKRRAIFRNHGSFHFEAVAIFRKSLFSLREEGDLIPEFRDRVIQLAEVLSEPLQSVEQSNRSHPLNCGRIFRSRLEVADTWAQSPQPLLD